MMIDLDNVDRVERLLALILTSLNKDSSLRERAFLLSTAGFTNIEIADLLDTSPAVVSQSLYELRRNGSKKKSGRSRRKS